MKSHSPSIIRFVVVAALLSIAMGSRLDAQSGCGTSLGSSRYTFPQFTQNVDGVAVGSRYLYILTQYGFARASIADPGNPQPWSLAQIGLRFGNGGVVTMDCDCWQGGNTWDFAEAPDGSVRMVSDWNAAKQGGGLPGQLARADGAGNLAFGQQIAASQVPQGSQMAAIYLPLSNRYVAYYPTESGGIQLVDVTNTTGNPDPSTALVPYATFPGWINGVRLRTAHVQIPSLSYDRYLMLGAMGLEQKLRLAEIDASNGTLREIASISTAGEPDVPSIAVVNNRIFLFVLESGQGVRVYEFVPSGSGGTISFVGSLPGNLKWEVVKGAPNSPFPALFVHRVVGPLESYIDIYDTKWLVQGGSPVRAASLRHVGAPESFQTTSFDALVAANGAAVTAYLYRPAGKMTGATELSMQTDKIDISCISADLSAPPVAGGTLPNLSAAQRTGSEATTNYFGDRFHASNSSSTAAPLTQIQWDLNVASIGSPPVPTFQPDAAFSGAPTTSLTDINPMYFPCDPSGTVIGDPRTGTNCYASVGNPAGGSTFRFGIQVANANGPSAAPFISPAITMQAPSAEIAGLFGTVLRVLTGGQADASGSQGNVAEATFTWTFQTSAGPLAPMTGPVVNVPAGVIGFDLAIQYKGGYVARASGSVDQKDLVPEFSVSPNPVLNGGTLTIQNQMLIGNAVLNSVGYTIRDSVGNAVASGVLANATTQPGFLVKDGTATVTAPSTTNPYSLELSYNFTPNGGSAQSLPISHPFSTTNFAPTPVPAVYLNSARTQPAPYLFGYQLNTGTAYYLFDGELLPTGITHPGSQWFLVTGSSETSLGTSAGAGPVTYTFTSACTSGCSLKLVVPGALPKSVSAFIAAPLPPPPPPPPPPPGGRGGVLPGAGGGTPLSVSLNCPSQGATGTPVTCTAAAGGGTSPYSYAWNWDFNFVAASYTPDSATPPPHTYSAPGTFVIGVRATDAYSGAATNSATITIVQSGPPRPLADFTVPGANRNQFNGTYEVEAGHAYTFIGSEPDPGATFAWDFGDGQPRSGRSVQYTFNAAGTRGVALTVTGGGTVTSGVTSAAPRQFIIRPPSFQALMIPGAGHIDPVPPATDGTWATDIAVTNPGTQPMTLTLDFETFGTAFPSDLSQIPFNSVNSVPLAAGQSWSATDVVKARLGKDGKGVLILKYEGGNADPIATATVYYTAQGRSFGSSLPTFQVGPNGTTTQSLDVASEQTLVGLRNDSSYRFNVSLFNASGQSGFFHLTAFGEDGVQVPLLDGSGAQTLSRDFPIGAFQQSLVQAADLGLTDSTKRYILKASAVGTGGTLLAAASALDRRNNDLSEVSDDTPRIAAAVDTQLDYFIPGVGRIGRDDVADGPHWKTDLTLYSNSSVARDLTFEYRFTDRNGAEQRVLAPVTIGPTRSVILDDVVKSVLARYAPAGIDLTQDSTLGLLRIYYRAASDSATAPLLIGGRIYDDRGTAGTAGMQLFVYSNGESVAPGSPLVLPGAQQNLRFRTNIGFFAMGDSPTRVRVTAVKQDGSVAGVFDFVLNDPTRSGHYAQLPMSAIPGIVGDPMTIRVEVLEGSRVGAYVVTVDQISSDTVFIQGRPTHLLN